MESDKSPNVPSSSAALTLALLSWSILTISLLPLFEAFIKAVSPVLANDNRTTENKKRRQMLDQIHSNMTTSTRCQQHKNHSTIFGRSLIQKITYSNNRGWKTSLCTMANSKKIPTFIAREGGWKGGPKTGFG